MLSPTASAGTPRTGNARDPWSPQEAGLFLLRTGIGIVFLRHGVPKFLGTPEHGARETWEMLGGAMGAFGIHFAPVFWGFLSAFAEAAGGLALVLGVLVRPFAALMLVNMLVATAFHAGQHHGWAQISHPLSLAIVFLCLLLAGGGRLAAGRALPGLRGKWHQ